MLRRTVFGLILALLATLGPLPFAQAGPDGRKPTIGFVYSGPVGDVGWTYTHEQARLALVEKYPVDEASAVLISFNTARAEMLGLSIDPSLLGAARLFDRMDLLPKWRARRR